MMGRACWTHVKFQLGNSQEGRIGKQKHKWEDRIKVNLKSIECEGVDWIELIQAVVKTAMYLRAPYKVEHVLNG
jgi:hypothetical protein